MSVLDRILGPRPPKGGRGEEARRYQLPTWLFAGAAGLLLVSLFLPYWALNLKAPQFPKGLQVRAYINRLVGDVGELEGLNHYVGLKSFEDAAVFEKSVAIIAVIVLVGLLVAALLIHTRWVLMLVLPALLFPFSSSPSWSSGPKARYSMSTPVLSCSAPSLRSTPSGFGPK
jgi:copper chaperone NosL